MSIGREYPENQGIQDMKAEEILPFLCGGFSRHVRRLVGQHGMEFTNKKCIPLGVGITRIFQMT
ncbi:MAG: hypothetical protein ACREBB_01180 [Nitrosotalea sp.]